MKQIIVFFGLVFLPFLGFGQFGEEQIVTVCEICTPIDVISEDLDGDGDLDVITAAEFDGKIAWFENLGNGNFSVDFQVIGAANVISQIEGSDIDNDGDIDIISASIRSKTLFWFENDGLGNFSDKIIIARENYSLEYFSIDDIDKDGNDDITVASRGGKIAWYANQGNGIFSNDGNIDIVISYFQDRLIWIKNEGNGDFSTIMEIENEFEEELIFSIEDLDDDGLLDIIGLATGGDSFFWYKNNGDGNFSAAQRIASDYSRPRAIISADLDADGDKDIIASSSNEDNLLIWFENDGNENFSTQKVLHERAIVATSIISSDLDNDGMLDILSVFSGKSEIAWFRNEGNSDFSTINTIFNRPSGTISIENADFDLDGIQDVLTTFYKDDEIIWYKIDEEGQFSEPNIISNSFIDPLWVFPADLDGDNDDDVLAASYSTNEIVWFENMGASEFSSQNLLVSTFDGIVDLVAVDLDNDGDLDIVFNNFSFGIFWLENDGNANFGNAEIISFNVLDGHNFEIVDLDGDGDMDITSSSPSRLVWFENEGEGNFSNEQLIDTPNSFSLKTKGADLDGDGDMDILHSSINDGTLFWHENDGNGNFSNANLISDLVRLIIDFTTGDIDNDGDLDIIVSANEEGKIAWFENYGGGNFSSQIVIASNYGFQGAVHLMDLDRDNDLDLLVSSFEEDKIAWFENLFELPQISGNVFWDDNSNKIRDENELGLNNLQVMIEPSNILSNYSDLNGNFHFFVERDTTYQISVKVDSCWAMTTDSSVFSITLSDENITNVNFGYNLANDAEKAEVSIISAPTRCGFEVATWLSIENVGCQTIFGSYAIVLDSLTEFVRSEVPPVAISGDTLFWNYEPLISRDVEKIFLVLQMPGPEFIGEIITLKTLSYIENDQGELELSSTYDYKSEIRCAYDPNDKLVHPNRSFGFDQNYTLFEETMEYTVRFQNTGNDTAFNVVIRDNLDGNLDWTTFKPIIGSHPFETLLHKDGLVEFSFKNILLPDSTTNEPLSHGFITYTIAPKAGLAENTLIENTASIFFDFNPPIVTNTIQSVMVSELPRTTSVKELAEEGIIKVYPNPFTDYLIFEYPDLPIHKPPMLRLFDVTGKLVKQAIMEQPSFQLRLPQMNNGLYFYQLMETNGQIIGIGKVIKNNTE